jgi:phosphohistidine phosphatase
VERVLGVLRHSKATHDPGFDDMDRPLTKRGLRDASAAGQWLLAGGLIPDLVRCSAAVRTRQTWRQVSTALGPAAEHTQVSVEPRLYEAGAAALLDVVRESPPETGMVLLVGHNPASHQLVLDLTGRRDLAFPTSALAVIELPGQWAAAAPGAGELAQLWTPRDPA